MFRVSKVAALGLVLGALVLSASKASAADNYFAMAAMRNDTNLPITYGFRWGNDQWQWYTLQPGQLRWHAWPYNYPNQNQSPMPQVRFDHDLSLANHFTDYNLVAFAAPIQDPGFAKVYAFRMVTPYLLDLVG